MSSHQSRPQDELHSDLMTPFEAAVKGINKATDPFGVMASQFNASAVWLKHPQEFLQAAGGMTRDLLALYDHGLRQALGLPSDAVFAPDPDDTRFADPTWTESPAWGLLKESYLAITRRLQHSYLVTPGLSDHERRIAVFWQRNWLDMLAPTNFFWLNPQAIKRLYETRCQSVWQGWSNFVRDVEARNIMMVEPDAFTVGKDLGTTPGKVIFRNRLLELIHYVPTTRQVRAMPILIVTPWINKYYILDLTANKSMVKFLTDQGFSVFITSWKNPTSEMSGVQLDDYLLEGINESVRVVTEFCRVPRVHLVGYCLGGTLVTTYMAWANKRFGADRMPVADWTLFATLTDFSQPGEIDIFIDEDSIVALEKMMAEKGYLDGSAMAASFRLLRSNSLIWNYWVQSYLLGQKLPAFDVLFWNLDTTRMPQAMHSFYLRQMYLNNNLVKRDGLSLGGESIDLNRIVQPLYAVTAEDDHVAPWQQCYRIRRYVNAGAPVRFVLSTSGHVLGIVNPPVEPPKRSYRIGAPQAGEDSEQWLNRTTQKPGSWWPDWVAWLQARSGKMVSARTVSNRKFPALADAPGTYVLEK